MFSSSPLTAALLLVAAVTLFADPVTVSEWNWTDGNGLLHEYRLVNTGKCSWERAASGVVDGWYLATVTSAQEQEALIAGLSGYRGEYWLGGYQTRKDTDPEDDWAWVTGEAWEYKNWAPGEPNDYWGAGSEQHLAVWSQWGESQWLWNDEAYLPNISGYVMEHTQSSVPEPGTAGLLALGLFALAASAGEREKRR